MAVAPAVMLSNIREGILQLNEHDRLLALRAYEILDTEPERDFDDIARLAAHTFQAPISIISLIDEKREWFKSRVGIRQTEAPRDLAFCEYTYRAGDVFIVPDAQADPRFRENPFVLGDPFIRFYAGVPLTTAEGYIIGALCVIDTVPREATTEQIHSLRMLSNVVMTQLNLRRANRENAALFRRQTESEQSLRENAELLGNVMATIPHMVFWKDRESNYLGCNAHFAQAAGLASPHEVVGKTDFDLGLTREEADAYRADDRRVMESGEAMIDEEETIPSGGDYPTYRLTSKLTLHDSAGSIVGILGISQDITERKLLEAERERLHAQTQRLLAEAIERSNRDALTGLLNHRAFHNQLEVEAERADRTGKPLAVAMMDLDNFKFFNDAYGHRAGDDVLRLIASVLGESCRASDCLARFGGDEFAMLLPGLGRADATRLVARMTEVLDKRGYIPPGASTPIPLRISVGVAVYPHEAATRLEAIEFADTRLRLAKGGADDTVLAADLVRNTMRKRVKGFSMLDALIAAVDNKDRYTRKHSEEVLAYSIDICRELGLPEDIQQDTAVAALLHDVGKIGVPDPILRKPSRLTPEEFEIIKQHVTMGAIIVQAVPGFEMTLDAIRHHHERWDGGGYPNGMRGEEIPMMARIIGVADAFSAMTTDRPYRKGMTPEVALEVLYEGIEAQWDAECVRALARSRQNATAVDAVERAA